MYDGKWKRSSPECMSPRAVNDNEACDESASEKKENTTLYGDDELELVERTVQFRTDDSRLLTPEPTYS